MKLRELIRILTQAGFYLLRDSKHKLYQHANGLRVIVPHANRIHPNTARAILKDAGLR